MVNCHTHWQSEIKTKFQWFEFDWSGTWWNGTRTGRREWEGSTEGGGASAARLYTCDASPRPCSPPYPQEQYSSVSVSRQLGEATLRTDQCQQNCPGVCILMFMHTAPPMLHNNIHSHTVPVIWATDPSQTMLITAIEGAHRSSGGSTLSSVCCRSLTVQLSSAGC